ncbi:MAG: hypothetical protein KGI60_00345 [Patescibacteria group bacterium]|nr:hypothetical protein [Patescibacteria group bacterium]
MRCTVLTGSDTKNIADVARITLPGVNGELSILEHHAEAFFLLASGTAVIEKTDKSVERISVQSGGCHVREDSVLIVA